jgi:hypothetical protein
MRKLRHLRAGVAISLALSLCAAVWSVQTISLSPLGISPRSLEMATATTHVLIDTPTSAVIDLRQDTYSVDGLKNRTVLLGNVIASSSVQAKIARRAHVPVDVLRIQPPVTAQQSAPPMDSENARNTSDILKSMDQYRVDIKANPTVPMIDLYAQAPTAESAAALANASADELKAYLTALATTQGTPPRSQIHIIQLGRATGVVINEGVRWQVAILAFLLTLAISCATVTLLTRIRAGWRQEALSEHASASAADGQELLSRPHRAAPGA